MSMSVHLYLTEDGKQIEGEGFERTGGSEDRENTIECVEFQESYARSPKWGLIRIKKPIDKSSPVLFEHLKQGILEAEFRCFRPSPTGDGSVDHFLTVKGRRGRVIAIMHMVGKEEYDLRNDGNDSYDIIAGTDGGAHEFVQFQFDAVETEYTKGGIIGELEFKAAKK